MPGKIKIGEKMKKYIAAIFLSVLMALCLVGCGSDEPAAVQKNEDGSVTVPEVLRPYLGIDVIKK